MLSRVWARKRQVAFRFLEANHWHVFMVDSPAQSVDPTVIELSPRVRAA
jgi:hypothetical protein